MIAPLHDSYGEAVPYELPDFAKTAQRETQARTKETRKLLLEAAERMFVRENFQSVREFYISQVSDRAWALLTKLFAMRHPESKRRLRQAYKLTRPADIGSAFHRFFGAEAAVDNVGIDGAVAALTPIVSSLVLESQFEPVLLSETRLTLILQRIFDSLIVPEKT